jgi:hypothetical protein
MKKVLLTVASGMALLIGMAAPAAAATTGAQRFTIVFVGEGDQGTVVASGPVAGVGSEVQISGDDVTGTDVATFRNGTVNILHTDTDFDGTFNDRTCIGRFSGSGDYTFVSGTGAYAGVSGSGTYTYRGTFFGHPTATGCSEDGLVVNTVRATGTTTLP